MHSLRYRSGGITPLLKTSCDFWISDSQASCITSILQPPGPLGTWFSLVCHVPSPTLLQPHGLLLFLKLSRDSPTSGPLSLLYPLSGMFFPQNLQGLLLHPLQAIIKYHLLMTPSLVTLLTCPPMHIFSLPLWFLFPTTLIPIQHATSLTPYPVYFLFLPLEYNWLSVLCTLLECLSPQSWGLGSTSLYE